MLTMQGAGTVFQTNDKDVGSCFRGAQGKAGHGPGSFGFQRTTTADTSEAMLTIT